MAYYKPNYQQIKFKSKPNLVFDLHPKQGEALISPATEIFFGGAAGGGKSHLMRIAAIIWASEIPGLQIYLFRRTFPDLIKTHMDGPTGFRQLLGPWVERGLVKIVEKEIRFLDNGSKINLCHCQNDADRWEYRSYEFHVLLIDELTSFSNVVYRFLRSRVRMDEATKERVPKKYGKGFFPRILASSNPGDRGHLWVKDTFVDSQPPYEVLRTKKEEGGFLRQFIPSKLDDNPSLDKQEYEMTLSGLGNPALIRAMLEGDWRAIQGAFFPEFCEEHILEPFNVPLDWPRFRSFDWGSAKPFCVLWWAIANGESVLNRRGEVVSVPRGALVCYREWYGKSDVDKGLKLRNEEIAAGILGRERQDEKDLILYSVADPSIFKEEGGESIAEVIKRGGVNFRPGDNKRIPGAARFRDRLIGEESAAHGGRVMPMIYWFNTCLDCIRTIPVLQTSENDPEDCDTKSEDHAYDAARYGVMSRPYTPPRVKPREESLGEGLMMGHRTLNELWDEAEAEERKFKRL